MSNIKYTCPCCGYFVFDEVGSDDICLICGWEDDLSQLRFPMSGGGANDESLIQAQENITGHEDSHGFERDPKWRKIDRKLDNIEISVPGIDYGMTYPEDLTRLYYWMPNYWRRDMA